MRNDLLKENLFHDLLNLPEGETLIPTKMLKQDDHEVDHGLPEKEVGQSCGTKILKEAKVIQVPVTTAMKL